MKPIAAVTPGHSPYHANYNNPVMFTDPLGLCPECPRDKRYYDARDNFMDYEPTSYVSSNLNRNSWVHSIGRNSRVYERYQMWSDARTLGLDEYAQKYGETYTNMNAYWRYYQEEQIANGVQVKRPQLIILGHASRGYFPLERTYVGPDSPQPDVGIDSNYDAVYQYLFGDGSPQAIGPNTTRALMNTETFRGVHNDILRGRRDLTGEFRVDMTDIVSHIGRTLVGWSADPSNQTITYSLYLRDGFWDPDFIDERVLGEGLGIPMFQADGMGPNLERLGGTPYEYIPTVITVPMTLRLFKH